MDTNADEHQIVEFLKKQHLTKEKQKTNLGCGDTAV